MTLRLPRALCAFAVGGLLALAGALMQVVLRNPLADPYVLGISGGAAVGALLAILAGAAAMVAPAAFAGALLSTSIVFTLAGRHEAAGSTRLLLTGVVVAAGWGALIALLLSLAPAAQIEGHAVLADRRPRRRRRAAARARSRWCSRWRARWRWRATSTRSRAATVTPRRSA